MDSWFFLTAGAVVCLSVFLLLTKRMLNDQFDPFVYGGLMQLMTGIFGIFLLPFSGFIFVLTPQTLALLAAVAVTYTIAASLYYYALRSVDLSEFSVLETMTMVWGLIIGLLWFGETVTPYKVLAITGIIAAIVLVTGIRTSPIRITRLKILAVVATFFYAVGAALDKYLTGVSNPASYLVLSFVAAGSLMTAVHGKRLWRQRTVLFSTPAFFRQLLINSAFVVAAYSLQFSAYAAGGELSKIFILLQTQTILVTILGIAFLRETANIPKKLLAAALAFGGVFLINL